MSFVIPWAKLRLAQAGRAVAHSRARYFKQVLKLGLAAQSRIHSIKLLV